MNLKQLCEGSNQIFRGTVVNIEEISIEAGGGTLPALRYQVKVDDAFTGQFKTIKGEKFAEFTMLGNLKQLKTGQAMLPGLPMLQSQQEYLLMVGAPGPVGLSSIMGLGQGMFNIVENGKSELATNQADNVGLFNEMHVGFAPSSHQGPISYDQLATTIRSLVNANQGGR